MALNFTFRCVANVLSINNLCYINSLYPCELEMKDITYFETYSDILLEKDVTGGNLITKLYDKSYDF